SRYLRLALTSPRQRKQMGHASGSTAQPHLYLRDLRALQLHLPPMEEQQQVVERVVAVSARADAVREAVDIARRRAQALRRAILARAFRGELVPQDADDEPASALLERILAEQVAQPKRTREVRATP